MIVVIPMLCVRVVKNFLAPRKSGMVDVAYTVSVRTTGLLLVTAT